MPDSIRPLWLLDAPNHSSMSVANHNLAAGMARIGCKPILFALKNGENAADFAATGTPVRIFPRLGSPFLGGAALKEAQSHGVTLVHALSADMLKRAERLAKKLRLPLFVTCNRLDEDELRTMAGFKGQGVIAVSRAIHERLVYTSGLPQNRIRVIHNGLDLSRFPRPSFGDTLPGVKWRCPVIGTLGHLSQKKGQWVFLQAVKILLEKGLDAEFVVLGDGPDRMALRSLADELKVTKRVTFTPQTVSGQLGQLDLLVEPSLQEGLGMSVMQAMAAGVPVVATGVGGLYDLIEDGVTGVMVPVSDPEALAAAIWRLLQNPSERQDMAKQARDMIERDFGADHVGEKLLDYYQDGMERFQSGGE